jgi:hypothetical protein
MADLLMTGEKAGNGMRLATNATRSVSGHLRNVPFLEVATRKVGVPFGLQAGDSPGGVSPFCPRPVCINRNVYMTEYDDLAKHLKAKGIGTYFQNPDQLVISDQNPAMPSSNCFWVSKREVDWFLGTWLPAIYQVPSDQDICSVCEIVFRSSPSAIYTVNTSVAQRLGLRRLSDEESENLGLA